MIALIFAAAIAPHSIWAWPECLPRELDTDLRAIGAESWEIQAIEAITRGGLSKRPIDYVRPNGTNRIVLGWAHFPATAQRLGLSPPRPDESDLDHYWAALTLLYSDGGVLMQLDAWRAVVGPAVERARAAGWRGRRVVLAAALANSGPGTLIRLGEECGWKPGCVAARYAAGSAHRARRVAWLQ